MISDQLLSIHDWALPFRKKTSSKYIGIYDLPNALLHPFYLLMTFPHFHKLLRKFRIILIGIFRERDLWYLFVVNFDSLSQSPFLIPWWNQPFVSNSARHRAEFEVEASPQMLELSSSVRISNFEKETCKGQLTPCYAMRELHSSTTQNFWEKSNWKIPSLCCAVCLGEKWFNHVWRLLINEKRGNILTITQVLRDRARDWAAIETKSLKHTAFYYRCLSGFFQPSVQRIPIFF